MNDIMFWLWLKFFIGVHCGLVPVRICFEYDILPLQQACICGQGFLDCTPTSLERRLARNVHAQEHFFVRNIRVQAVGREETQ